jgi:putative protease
VTTRAATSQNLASFNTPKSVGEKLGVIQSFDSKSITVKFESKALSVNAGDGICWFDKNGVLHGTNVNRAEGNKLWLNNMQNVSAGATLFRNFDIAFQKLLSNPHSAKRLIDVKITLETFDKSVQITAVDEDNISTSQLFDYQLVIANNKAKALATAKEQLSKSGSSIFNVVEVEIKDSKSAFYTISELNSWRRTILELLEEKRNSLYIFDNQIVTKNNIPYPELSLSFKGNVLNSLARQFYERHGVREVASAYELEKPAGEAELMRTRYCLLRELGGCKKEKSAKHLREPLFLENNGRRLRLSFDCKNCEMTVLG